MWSQWDLLWKVWNISSHHGTSPNTLRIIRPFLQTNKCDRFQSKSKQVRCSLDERLSIRSDAWLCQLVKLLVTWVPGDHRVLMGLILFHGNQNLEFWVLDCYALGPERVVFGSIWLLKVTIFSMHSEFSIFWIEMCARGIQDPSWGSCTKKTRTNWNFPKGGGGSRPNPK